MRPPKICYCLWFIVTIKWIKIIFNKIKAQNHCFPLILSFKVVKIVLLCCCSVANSIRRVMIAEVPTIGKS